MSEWEDKVQAQLGSGEVTLSYFSLLSVQQTLPNEAVTSVLSCFLKKKKKKWKLRKLDLVE